MPDMKAITIAEARRFKPELIERKVDGSRMRFHHNTLLSNRDVNRNARYGHVLREVSKVNWKIRGEMALEFGNVLQLNKRESWPSAKLFIFDIFEHNGKSTTHLSPRQARDLIDNILNDHRFDHLKTPEEFKTFEAGWKYIEEHDLEGLVLKDKNGECFKVKKYKEEKLPIVGYEKGKKKGAFIIERNGVRSKVSGTSEGHVRQYEALLKRGLKPLAEIEYLFLTGDGIPFQPKLRRIGTADSLSTT